MTRAVFKRHNPEKTIKMLARPVVALCAITMFLISCSSNRSVSDPVVGSSATQDGTDASSSTPPGHCITASPGTLPSGACELTAECQMTTPSTCSGGVAFRPSTDPEWDCKCPNGVWACTVIRGGLGQVPCGNSEADSGVSLDAGLSACDGADGGAPISADALPAGACSSDGAICGATTQSTCEGGVKYRPATNPQWECTCHGSWSCKVIGGGLGSIACAPDGG